VSDTSKPGLSLASKLSQHGPQELTRASGRQPVDDLVDLAPLLSTTNLLE
jgi:hypothetical protein